MKLEIQPWEDEGGALRKPAVRPAVALRGSDSQVEWAERIRQAVNGEFDRVAEALLSAARKQSPENQSDAEFVITILEEKRAEVMAMDLAGYFIHEWQETNGRVRQMIMKDPRYAMLRSKRDERRSRFVHDIPNEVSGK